MALVSPGIKDWRHILSDNGQKKIRVFPDKEEGCLVLLALLLFAFLFNSLFLFSLFRGCGDRHAAKVFFLVGNESVLSRAIEREKRGEKKMSVLANQVR